jgi:hypothetical protein
MMLSKQVDGKLLIQAELKTSDKGGDHIGGRPTFIKAPDDPHF